jgi:hypothetical protein
MKLINKEAVMAEIKSYKNNFCDRNGYLEDYETNSLAYDTLCELEGSLDAIEVIDPYEQNIQYDSIKAGIQAHAETYSFNIESELFNQLTKEQQALWRKEIEQACISGGEAGVELARDLRYKENVEGKEVNLEKHLKEDIEDVKEIAKLRLELGLKVQKGE